MMGSSLVITASPPAHARTRLEKKLANQAPAQNAAARKSRRETLRPLLEALVDRGQIGRAILPLWVQTYPPADAISLHWLNLVIAERLALRGRGEEEVPE